MTKENMTVHKALSELKVLDARINKIINESNYCTTVKHYCDKVNGKKIEDAKVDMKAAFDKVTDLIARQTAIKKAVTLANATTKVTIAGVEMTVAEAIWYKNHGVNSKQSLLTTLAIQYEQAISLINKTNGDALAQKADTYIQNAFGTKEKTTPDELTKERDEYIKKNSLDYIEGFDVKATIEKLTDEIDSFISEVDSTLSVSNALTVIEIEY